MRTEVGGVAVISKMVKILDAVSDCDHVNVAQVSERVHMPRTTVFRILNTLVAEGVLTKEYRPHARLLMWAHSALQSMDLREASAPFLESLLQRYEETASVYVRVGETRICLDRREGLNLLRHMIVIGQPMPLHAGSAGRILMAWLDEQTREDLLQQSRERFPTIHSSDSPDWDAIQRQGWSMSRGERDPALASISVPIFTSRTEDEPRVEGALSISGALQRFTRMNIEEVAQELKSCALSITTRMTGADFKSVSEQSSRI